MHGVKSLGSVKRGRAPDQRLQRGLPGLGNDDGGAGSWLSGTFHTSSAQTRPHAPRAAQTPASWWDVGGLGRP